MLEQTTRRNAFYDMMKEAGLLSAVAQRHTFESVHPAIQEVRRWFPGAGALEMRSLLLHEQGLKVGR
jgi:hypothetical protein